MRGSLKLQLNKVQSFNMHSCELCGTSGHEGSKYMNFTVTRVFLISQIFGNADSYYGTGEDYDYHYNVGNSNFPFPFHNIPPFIFLFMANIYFYAAATIYQGIYSKPLILSTYLLQYFQF